MKNSGTAFALAMIAFVVALAIVVGSRLSEQTTTLLMGAACGAGLSVPFAILAGMYFGSQRAAREREAVRPQPPIVVMTPPQQQPTVPMLPMWSSMQPAAPGMSMPVPRQYTILGEETVIDGTPDVWE